MDKSGYMKKELVVIGAGPAGLAASIQAAKAGVRVLLVDENILPGGQLFKQIHKFFGSKEHKAGVRGIDIGQAMLNEAQGLPIELWLNSEVCGIFGSTQVWIVRDKKSSVTVEAESIIIATGAVENGISFPGWTLPGVMGAGAAQTMINLHRVLPGKQVITLGSGNVGTIVSYQLMQAGAEVLAVVEGAPFLGAYGVHTAKLCRAGTGFYTNHTIICAKGCGRVEEVVIGKVAKDWSIIKGSELSFAADTICLAVGLTPLAELAFSAGCAQCYNQGLGGFVPQHDSTMRTSLTNIFVAGDITGIEEASTAMEEGRLAGVSACLYLNKISQNEAEDLSANIVRRLSSLRSGPFGEKRAKAKESIFSQKGV